jgi:N-acetylglucosamine kinase-like BadF-type ATPase
MEAILAIDGGASRTRCVAVNRAGRILGEAESGPSNHLQQSDESIEQRLAEVTERTLQAASLSKSDISCLSAGLAGVDYDGYGAEPMNKLFHRLGFTHCLVHGDMVIAHAAALGMQPGIVVIAGTGSVILGIDDTGCRVRVGGWGPLYGDEGSAQHITAAALRAAARAHDGRGPATALLEALTQALGLPDFRSTISILYGPNAKNIAALCPIVHQIAVAGDAVARSLFDAAGDELNEGVVTAARRLRLESFPLLISYQGGVAEHCPLLVERMRARLSERLPHAQLVPPRWRPVTGAYLLGRQALGWEGKVE